MQPMCCVKFGAAAPKRLFLIDLFPPPQHQSPIKFLAKAAHCYK